MKTIHNLIFAVALSSYLFLMCGDHAENEQDHDHSHSSEQTSETGAHSHEDEEHDHAHEEEEHTHTHEESDDAHADVEHDHEHSTEDIITVEGAWEKLIGLETVSAEIAPIELLISAPGQIIPNENQVAIISPFIESSVNSVFVNIGEPVKKGDLLTCLASPEIGILRAEYDKAKAELEIEKQNYARKKKLFDEKIISDKAFREAELNQRVAEVNFNYALKKLIALGISEEEIESPPIGHSEAVGSTIHIYAPIDGVITRRNASIGQKVDHSSRLFEIINVNNVWLEADIFEKELIKISIGQNVRIRVSAYENEAFSGKIFFIASTLNKDTKTIKILVEINNQTGKLKPGMFARANIVVGQKARALVIPKRAILDDENLQIVFVKEETGYHRHKVETGIVSDEYVEILSGLNPGSVVVTNGNYQLKSKIKMGTIDPHAGQGH